MRYIKQNHCLLFFTYFFKMGTHPNQITNPPLIQWNSKNLYCTLKLFTNLMFSIEPLFRYKSFSQTLQRSRPWEKKGVGQMDAGVFELKIQLFFCGKTMPISMWYESLIESLQSNFHTPLKLWLKVCSQTFIPPWKFTLKVSVKVSGPLESFNWNFQPCILATIVI
jgi:hypothetical protein